MYKFGFLNFFLLLPMITNTVHASAPATGTVVYGPTTAVPSLTGNMLIVLSLLLMVVAYKLTKHKNSNKFFVTLIGTAALISATGGVKVISDVDAGGDVINLDNPAGDTVTFPEGGLFTFYNNSGVTQQIKSITEPATPSGCPNFPSGGTVPIMIIDNECIVGMILNNGQVCNLDCTNSMAISDKRLKREIEVLKELNNGIKLYSFKYQWNDQSYVGVMAQDLLKHPEHRQSVITLQSGHYGVNYQALGLKMITLKVWEESSKNIFIL